MDKNTEKKNHISITTIIFVMFFVAIFAVGSTFAWFTEQNDLESQDEVAVIEMQLLNSANEVMTDGPSFVYQSAGTQTIVIKVKANAGNAINAISRIMITASWSNNEPVYIPEIGNTVTYSYNQTDWSETFAGDIGYNYVYCDSVLSAGETMVFLNSITFPTLPSQYEGATLTLSVAVTGLQANSAGVALWAEEAPLGWNPLGV